MCALLRAVLAVEFQPAAADRIPVARRVEHLHLVHRAGAVLGHHRLALGEGDRLRRRRERQQPEQHQGRPAFQRFHRISPWMPHTAASGATRRPRSQVREGSGDRWSERRIDHAGRHEGTSTASNRPAWDVRGRRAPFQASRRRRPGRLPSCNALSGQDLGGRLRASHPCRRTACPSARPMPGCWRSPLLPRPRTRPHRPAPSTRRGLGAGRRE